MTETNRLWRQAMVRTLNTYRQMIDEALAQLSDEEFNASPQPGINSVAVIIQHLSGNLHSRWTDFLDTDGEKPDRNREGEFQSPECSRTELMQNFDRGWRKLESSIEGLTEKDFHREVTIRGELHSVPLAIARSITHIAYHAGQIMWAGRMSHQGHWRWLSIEPGTSDEFNRKAFSGSERRDKPSGK